MICRLKIRDEHNRWRNKTVAFRVSPEEWQQIETICSAFGFNQAGLYNTAINAPGSNRARQSESV